MGQNESKSDEDEEGVETVPILMDDVTQKVITIESSLPLHKAAHLGELKTVTELLKTIIPDLTEPLTRSQDNTKRTPLHLAAISGKPQSVEICSRLLDADVTDSLCNGKEPLVNCQDAEGKTPLHYAAAAQHPELVTLLLDRGADPNIQDNGQLTPVHISAVGSSDAAIECIRKLLTSSNDAIEDPCGANRNYRNLVFTAVENMSPKMLTFLLEESGIEIDLSEKDHRGWTVLKVAALAGNSDEAANCVETLLKVLATDEINGKSVNEEQTALMMAAFFSYEKVVKVLINDARTDVFLTDSQNRTALHWAVEAWYRLNSLACVKLLAESEPVSGPDNWDKRQGYLYKAKDSYGDAPIDIALKNKAIPIIKYFVTADSAPEFWLKNNMLMTIYTTVPEVIIPLMDQGLRYNPATFHECEAISVGVGAITGFNDPNWDEPTEETKFLNQIMDAEKEIQWSIFLHPVVQIFLDLKWKKFQWLSWIGILFQFIWITMYTFMIFEIYVPNCPNENPNNKTSHRTNSSSEEKKKTLKFFLSLWFARMDDSTLTDCEFNHGTAQVFACILYFLSLLVVVKEVFQMKNGRYFRNFSNYAQVSVLVISSINALPVWQSSSEVEEWQSYLAAIGIFIAWAMSLREVGKFPQCGIYAAILKKVFLHCLKMMVFYFPLLIAFALCLRILVPGKGQYTYLFFAIVKVVIMMTGELDFEDAFYENGGPSLAVDAILGQFFFLLLVFITTIVLLNLLTGLAVNDVQILLQEAEINRLSNQLEQIYLWESLLLSLREKFKGKKRRNAQLEDLCSWNVTTIKYKNMDSAVFSCWLDVGTKNYSPELRKKIKEIMIPLVN